MGESETVHIWGRVTVCMGERDAFCVWERKNVGMGERGTFCKGKKQYWLDGGDINCFMGGDNLLI